MNTAGAQFPTTPLWGPGEDVVSTTEDTLVGCDVGVCMIEPLVFKDTEWLTRCARGLAVVYHYSCASRAVAVVTDDCSVFWCC